ncbi:hypothetical protein [Streptococcus salivarius]|uniref:hypothetical protein n=1 Tax=Streptococcus salivarius TaxID=1304 RepID=UPI0018977C56|nr:hypothetical protein [Streptococcus salivarius]
MNRYLIALLVLAVLFFLGLVLLEYGEDETTSNNPTEIYSQDEIALAEFLETREAINEDFLIAQKKLLETLNNEWRRF